MGNGFKKREEVVMMERWREEGEQREVSPRLSSGEGRSTDAHTKEPAEVGLRACV